jgi:hypothetical protein
LNRPRLGVLRYEIATNGELFDELIRCTLRSATLEMATPPDAREAG